MHNAEGIHQLRIIELDTSGETLAEKDHHTKLPPDSSKFSKIIHGPLKKETKFLVYEHCAKVRHPDPDCGLDIFNSSLKINFSPNNSFMSLTTSENMDIE